MASYVRGVPRNSSTNYSSGNINKNKSNENDNFPLGAQVQNVKASRVYVFGEGNIVDDEEEDVVEFEMRSRHKASFPIKQYEELKPDFFEREIRDGETLQAIALKYACNVADLKRLNNLIQDQEFFGLKTVKVPMARHGVVSESMEALQGPPSKTLSARVNGTAACPETDEDDKRDYFYDSESQHDFSDPETQIKVLKTLSIRENFSSQGREAEKFLRKMDKDLSKLKKSPSPRTERESLSEVISVLTNKSIRPLERTSSSNKHNGADCGISWWSLLIFTLAVTIVVPLLYLFYHYFLKS